MEFLGPFYGRNNSLKNLPCICSLKNEFIINSRSIPIHRANSAFANFITHFNVGIVNSPLRKMALKVLKKNNYGKWHYR